jgi:hypothetical protein
MTVKAQYLVYRPGDDQEGVETGVVEQIEDVYDEYEVFDGLIEYQDIEDMDHELSEDYANDRGGPRRRRPPSSRTRDRHPGTRYGPHNKPSYHKHKPKPSYGRPKPSYGRPKPSYGHPKKKKRPSNQKYKPTYKKPPSYKPRPAYRPKPDHKQKHKPIYKPAQKTSNKPKQKYKQKQKPSYNPEPKPGYAPAPAPPSSYDEYGSPQAPVYNQQSTEYEASPGSYAAAAPLSLYKEPLSSYAAPASSYDPPSPSSAPVDEYGSPQALVDEYGSPQASTYNQENVKTDSYAIQYEAPIYSTDAPFPPYGAPASSYESPNTSDVPLPHSQKPYSFMFDGFPAFPMPILSMFGPGFDKAAFENFQGKTFSTSN